MLSTSSPMMNTLAQMLTTSAQMPQMLITSELALTPSGHPFATIAAPPTVRTRRVGPGTVGICIGTRRVEEKNAHVCSNK
jgi:hypothetical protein